METTQSITKRTFVGKAINEVKTTTVDKLGRIVGIKMTFFFD